MSGLGFVWKGEGGRPRCFFTHCCCCSLRVPVYIVAVLDLIFCLGFVISLLIILSLVGLQSGRGSILAILLQFLVHACLACVLIHGARTERPNLLWAWLWARAVELFTDVARIIYLPILMEGFNFYSYFLIPILALILGMVVVRSYAMQLKAKAALVPADVRYDHEEVVVHA